MSEKPTLGIGVCGCGYWGMNYVRIFSELPDTEVIAVCDQDPARLQAVQQRFPTVKLCTNMNELLQMDAIQAVVISTQASAHVGVAEQSLKAGRHLLVEKPITTTADDARHLMQLAEQENLILMVGHTFMYNAGVRKVKEYLDQTERIYYMYARRTNLGPIRRDVNALWDLAPHDVSIFNFFMGTSPEWVSAVGANVLLNDRADVGFVALGYPDGVVGHIHVSWADPNKVREVVVVSSDRRIVFNDVNPQEMVRIFEKGVTVKDQAESYGEHNLLMRDGDIISPRIEPSEPLKNQCKHFVECVMTGTHPQTDAQAGLDVVRVMQAIDRSLERNGAPVALD
ncbi:MAG: Gfo/Idh/MocA family oxidoreductase [Chloroflexaceae bacterium]|nr:Gfo/Idh/MocA family oxidoreductase [Chloroflexaceae bacterium]